MKSHHSFIKTVNQITQNASKNKIAHLSTQDKAFDENKINIANKEVVNFGSCSYLGLEFDARVKQGAIEAVEKYGTQFSSSRAYVSLGLYDELENLFSQIFDQKNVLIAPTTTLGHLAAIPVLVQDTDAVILDHQVHSSVQNAANMLKARGIHVDMIRHNNLEMLERKIEQLKTKYTNIWYMADGIYSMYGDAAPVKDIHALMDKYPQLHFYVDDAHGMSCFGKNGAGYVFEQGPLHPRQVVAISLAKAFASGGSVLVFPDAETCQLVRNCGGPMITSGPMQPGSLGAAIASAKIHLTPEIEELKEDLHENLKFTNLMLKKHNLPIVQDTESPVFFIGVSLPKIGNRVIAKMIDRGYYLNLGIYPAVPLKNTGIRFTITRLHTFEQIENMIANLAECFNQTLAEEQVDRSLIHRAFKLKTAEEININNKVSSLLTQANLQVETHTSIHQITPQTWNTIFAGRGSFDWEGLAFLEATFARQTDKFNQWKFNYILIKDAQNQPILATFFTTSLGKDDMLSTAGISAQVEIMRKTEGDTFLTSTTLMMGSPLTEGDHLYLAGSSTQQKAALDILIDYAGQLQDLHQANTIMFRDFTTQNIMLDSYFMENGFVKTELPAKNSMLSIPWKTPEEWLASQSAKGRRHIRKTICKQEHNYITKLVKNANQAQHEHWFKLYKKVQENSLALNTNPLPKQLFSNIANHPNWEVLELHLNKNEITDTSAVAVIFNYRSANTYSAMFIGIDYAYQREFMPYRQALYQTIKRAIQTHAKTLHFGFTADFEKTRLGATNLPNTGYIQIKDHYNLSFISNLMPAKANH